MSASWLVFILGLLVWSAGHLGAFDLTATVTSSDGVVSSVPNTFATVDHPFHVSRAQTLLDSLRDGQILRWVGGHEGGYPVEFYPLGVPWLTVGVWAAALGTLSIASAFKLVVIAVFLAPVLAFAGLGRRDRIALPLAGLGLVAHLAVPGEWWSGGYTETVQWGLITNVAAYAAAFGFLAALLSFVLSPSRAMLFLAVGLSVFAVGTNTRSVLALGCVGLGVLLSVVIEHGGSKDAARRLIARYGVIAVPALLTSMPIWLSALRFSDLYEFIQYEFYDGLGAYWQSSINAVSWPVLALAGVGFILAMVGSAGPATRAVAWTLIAYVVTTIVCAGLGPDGGLIEQLEATRLMPFQRLLMIYLAATAVVAGIRAIERRRSVTAIPRIALLAVTVLLAIFTIIRPPESLAVDQRSMFPVETTANPEYADLLAAVEEADRMAAPGTAIFIAGSELGWHQPMWAPLATDRPLRYNDWLWLWQIWHRSADLTYEGQAIDASSLGNAFQPDELARHGVGAVVVLTPQLEALADRQGGLSRQDRTGYAVYQVRDSVSIITSDGGETLASTFANERITGTVEGDGGTATIRASWFPRWTATVNGRTAEVDRDANGQITVPVPAGRVEIVLNYGVDRWDVAGRIGSIAGLLLTMLLVLVPRFQRRWLLAKTGIRHADPSIPAFRPVSSER